MLDYEIFDDDGYPTDEFLNSISGWHWEDGFNDLLAHAMHGHIYPTYRSEEVDEKGNHIWRISTGGWSGNESIINALKDNPMFWAMCWVQSRRGGHYIFEVKPRIKK